MEDITDLDHSSHSVNFGGGLEYLMNNKKRTSNVKSQIDLAELDNLENELNDLSDGGTSYNNNNMFKFSGGGGENNDFDIVEENLDDIPSLGASTFETTKTWDGFSKMNMDSEMQQENSRPSPSAGLSNLEKRRKKRAMIKKINEWAEKGIIHNNPNYTMESSFEEVEDEYESCLDDKRKKDSVKMYGWWFMAGVNTIEYVNAAHNPFDLNLDGWGEQISDDLDSYEEIFAELYEKYKGGKMAPELSLILRLGCSAAMVNFTNKALSTATPGFNDIIRQSPELMKAFTTATVNTMSQQNPSVGFMNNIVNQEPTPNTSYGRPPPPVKTQDKRASIPQTRPGQMNMNYTQPDSRPIQTPMFREQGVSMNSNVRTDLPEKSQVRPRREMSGPNISDNNLDEILSSLKTKSNNVDNIPILTEDDSMISISSLKDLNSNTNLPKKRGRGKNSKSLDKTVSLDI